MEHNEFKDQLYEVLDENDVALGIEIPLMPQIFLQ